jgi:23S rRNA pseudouridine1911/1915/1917 synthase
MDLRILYEDEYILALDKPSGVMVHPDGRSKEPTLADWIKENYPELVDVGEEQTLQSGEKIMRPGIVHRLDRETSGVIIMAKTKEAHRFLKEQFQSRKIQKIYNAVVHGAFSPEKMEGTIDKLIGRSSGDFRRWSAEYGAKGEMREAVTGYNVLGQNEGFAYLEVRPKTGRTHQIRVHLKSISHPVVCDRLYGSKNSVCDGSRECLGFSRLALHALSIKLGLPNGTNIEIESPLPPEFEAAKSLLKEAKS